VEGFNAMLEELDRVRVSQQELVASARAAEAQQELVEAMPIALMVTSIHEHKVLHANHLASSWLGGISHDPWTKLETAVRERFFHSLNEQDEVNEFEVCWQIGNVANWAVLSACRLRYQGDEAVLTVFTPINQIKEMEQRLIESEKMASLGGLVAGVAHEINTPVGVGVTAASSLQESCEHLESLYQTEKMKKTDLEEFIDISRESSHMILRNLERAAELIQSFKQVAVDQSSEARRRFNIKGYLEEVVQSLGATLRQSGITCVIDCPDEIEIDSHPGVFAQIVTNLIMNALTHAYEPGQEGQISIKGQSEGGRLTLEFADDGNGIPETILGKIFDPFFTTKRGTGGSGLGLSIVYNLVTKTLTGAIECHSVVGKGTVFTVRI
jgi:signal transduction histidine kinase